MNTVCLTGRLVKEPEIRYTQTNKPVASFTLAVDRDYKDANGERQADFIHCAAISSSATFLEKYSCKGAKIGLTGMIQNKKWKDKDGNTRYSVEVFCDKVEILAGGIWENNEEYREKRRKKQAEGTEGEGSGYEVYTPPDMDNMDDSGLPL